MVIKKIKAALVVMIFGMWPGVVQAGCIGPAIMGQCYGQEVPWDTHQDAAEVQRPSPMPGFYYDHRGEEAHQGHIDIWGKDPHDPHWFEEKR